MTQKNQSGLFQRDYPNTPSKPLQKVPISDECLLAIGKLVRGTAELESCVDFFVMALSNVAELRARILLGRSSLSTKIGICKDLAKTRNDGALKAYKSVFSNELMEIVKTRNVVCHGTYLGWNKGGYAFVTSDRTISDEGNFGRAVFQYPEATLIAYAELLNDALPDIEKALIIDEARKKHLQGSLSNHPKSKKTQRSRKSETKG